ncbi:hypothetical protein [Celeribacter sp.]|uniref:hypothetical protein n=1 Tax=Celeribacter sp. TaxID=1890673 RepID=UPI003A93B1FB
MQNDEEIMQIIKVACLALVGTSMLAVSAQAAEITGGELVFSTSKMSDDTDLRALSLEGAVTVDVASGFSVQGDLAYYKFAEIDENVTAMRLHGLYSPSEAADIGLFYGREDGDGINFDTYGLEGTYTTGALTFEGYAMFGEDDEFNNGYGLSATYQAARSFDIEVAYDTVDIDHLDLDRWSVKGIYGATEGVSVFAEVGSGSYDFDYAGIEDNDSSSFIGAGIQLDMGRKGGAAMSQRGLSQLMPGL